MAIRNPFGNAGCAECVALLRAGTEAAVAGTAAMPAAVPRKELPVDEEAEARHTGKWVRSILQERSLSCVHT